MPELQPYRSHGFIVHQDQPLIGVIEQHDGHEVTRYYTEEPNLPPSTRDVQAALSAIGAWSDLDWDELIEALDRIRHASPPTAPLEL